MIPGNITDQHRTQSQVRKDGHQPGKKIGQRIIALITISQIPGRHNDKKKSQRANQDFGAKFKDDVLPGPLE